MVLRGGSGRVGARNLTGRVWMVTGATGALGREVARTFARHGAKVVLLCRDASRGEALQTEIRQATGNEPIEVLHADLAALGSVRAAAAVGCE